MQCVFTHFVLQNLQSMIIEREILHSLERWKDTADRSPLIVQGARQIGKSWVIEEFGRRFFKNTAFFNFDKDKELNEVFANTKDIRRLLSELELHTEVPIVPGETLIFFDEVQNCKGALNSLKYFKEDAPEFHVVAAGSLLGVATRHKTIGRTEDEAENTFPVGKITFLEMYPVTFREYLRMSAPLLLQRLETYISMTESLPGILFNQLTEHYRRFQVCGGLPKPCSDMLDGKGIAAIEEDLEDLRKAYEYDFTKHVDAKDIPRIYAIWRSIPSQLSKENKKFVFRVVRQGARAREYESAINWLVLSGMVYRIYCTEKPTMPLKHYENTTAFKVYMLDQAILRLMSELPPEALLAKGELLLEFKGAMAENYILSSLLAQGFKTPHYWTISGNKAEVDFLVQHKLDVIPIEVKAGTNVRGKSLIEYDNKYHPRLRVRFSMLNMTQDGNLLNIPLFLCDWLKDILNARLGSI